MQGNTQQITPVVLPEGTLAKVHQTLDGAPLLILYADGVTVRLRGTAAVDTARRILDGADIMRDLPGFARRLQEGDGLEWA